MKEGSKKRLNGWVRLWIAIAVLGLVPAGAIIFSEWESGDAWMHDFEIAAPTQVHVDGVGDVDFPATMSAEAIDLVVKASAGNREAIGAGIRVWDSELRRLLNQRAEALNRLLVMQVAALWAGGLVLLYVVGLIGAWVWRGFKR